MEISSKHYPGFWQAVGLLILLFALKMFGGVTYLVIARLFFEIDIPVGNLLKAEIVTSISYLIILRFGLYRTEKSFKDVFHLTSFNPLIILPLLFLLFGFNIIQSEILNVIFCYINFPDSSLTKSLQEIASGSALSFVALAIIAPFTEEFFYRGLILRNFIIRYSAIRAVLLSSFLFAVFHLNLNQFLFSFIIGVFLAWLFLKTNSLWPCILSHSILNGIVYLKLVAYPAFNIMIRGYTIYNKCYFHPVWFDMVGLLFVISGGMTLIWLLRQK